MAESILQNEKLKIKKEENEFKRFYETFFTLLSSIIIEK